MGDPACKTQTNRRPMGCLCDFALKVKIAGRRTHQTPAQCRATKDARRRQAAYQLLLAPPPPESPPPQLLPEDDEDEGENDSLLDAEALATLFASMAML